MQQPEKKTTSAFLEKFRGRTSKVDKSGLSHALKSDKAICAQEDENGKLRPRKLASLDARNVSQDYGVKGVELDGLPAPSPQRRQILPSLGKRATNPNILAKAEPFPMFYSPLIPLKETKQQLPPSRSTSDRSQNLNRRSFGKYLKLDNDAMRHFEFLMQIDGKGRKSSVGGGD